MVLGYLRIGALFLIDLGEDREDEVLNQWKVIFLGSLPQLLLHSLQVLKLSLEIALDLFDIRVLRVGLHKVEAFLNGEELAVVSNHWHVRSQLH